jgi:hypothetical protein
MNNALGERLRMRPIDIGVAVVVAAALVLALFMRLQTQSRMNMFQDEETGFRISYPVNWSNAATLQQVMLNVADPLTPSTVKTTLTVEQRGLDPAAGLSLSDLVNLRVEEHGDLNSYQFISEAETTVDGEQARQMEYAYVAQPLGGPRRAAVPVVLMAREYMVVAGDQLYMITLAAPEAEFDRSQATFDRIIQSAVLP